VDLISLKFKGSVAVPFWGVSPSIKPSFQIKIDSAKPLAKKAADPAFFTRPASILPNKRQNFYIKNNSIISREARVANSHNPLWAKRLAVISLAKFGAGVDNFYIRRKIWM